MILIAARAGVSHGHRNLAADAIVVLSSSCVRDPDLAPAVDALVHPVCGSTCGREN